MTYRYHPHARKELDDAADYYDGIDPQLGDDFLEHEEAIQQTATTGGGMKVMEEALEQAAEIRHKLEGRHHGDSTQNVVEDRQR